MRARRFIAIPIALAMAFAAGTVAADCELPGPPEDVLPNAPVAFVGTVVDLQPPMAMFEVHEVWAGNVARSVEVHGLTSGVQFSEDDRPWEEGATYLVVPIAEGGVLRDSICTATTEWTDDLAVLRPADALIYAATEPEAETSIPIAVPLVGLVVLLVVATSVFAFRQGASRPK